MFGLFFKKTDLGGHNIVPVLAFAMRKLKGKIVNLPLICVNTTVTRYVIGILPPSKKICIFKWRRYIQLISINGEPFIWHNLPVNVQQ